jgi:hypothetical protein
MNVFTYPVSDAGKRKIYYGQTTDRQPHGLGIMLYNQEHPEEHERYEGQFRSVIFLSLCRVQVFL